MAKIVRLTENELIDLVRRILKEEPESKVECFDSYFLTKNPFYKWVRNEGERGTYVVLGVSPNNKLTRFSVEVEPPEYNGKNKPVDAKTLSVLDKSLQGWSKYMRYGWRHNSENVYYYIDVDSADCEKLKQFYLTKFLPIQTKLKSLGFENL